MLTEIDEEVKVAEEVEPSEELIESELDENDDEYKLDIKVDEYANLGDSFALYIKDIAQYPLLSEEEEYNLAKKYRETGDEEARQKLVTHNLRLVVNIAKHFMHANTSLLDLVQEGTLGLITAVEKFDPDKGFKLSTYATWWIKQAIMRYNANNSRTIRLPVHVHEGLYKYNKFVTSWKSNNPTLPLPSLEEICETIGVTPETIKSCTNTTDVISLSTPIGEEQDSTIGDFISDETNIEAEAEQEVLKECVAEILNELSIREREVLTLRFGLNGNRTHTLEEVGRMFGVTRERIRQIEAKSLRKLRHPKRQRILKDFMERY